MRICDSNKYFFLYLFISIWWYSMYVFEIRISHFFLPGWFKKGWMTLQCQHSKTFIYMDISAYSNDDDKGWTRFLSLLDRIFLLLFNVV